MAKYRKKPVIVDATQWWKMGDHPDVSQFEIHEDDDRGCEQCIRNLSGHGSIPTLEGEHIVCPGDFIITGVKGEKYPCKPDIFAETYDLVEEEQPVA